MEGYSVTEAASILGVPTERVWELLARGVLSGAPEGETGMRVYLQPRPAPAPPVPEAARTNGDGGTREPERELSPFRELLTEFRNLTERYGQALLALGESRGEVASLRSRVDLLEARMDLRLPMGSAAPMSAAGWPAPAADVAPEAAVPSEEQHHDEEDENRRRRRRGHRRATESFAEALARAEDPTRPELPDAAETAAAIAALREETAAEGEHTPEAVLPRELPAAELIPLPEEPEATAEPQAPEPEPLPAAVAAAVDEEASPSLDVEAEIAASAAAVEAVAEPDVERSLDADVDASVADPEAEEAAPAIGAALGEEGAAVEPITNAADVAASVLEDAEVAPEPIEAVDDGAPEEAAPLEAPAEEPVEPVGAEQATTGEVEDIAATPAEEATPAAAEAEPVEALPDEAPAVAAAVAAVVEAEPEPEPEPIAWDPERYTVEIIEPDWYAEEATEPIATAPTATLASEIEPEPEQPSAAASEPKDAGRGSADAEPEPASPPEAVSPPVAPTASPPPPAQATAAEETMLWFGQAPEAAADEGADEIEVVGAAHRSGPAPMPGSQELDDALAALDALSQGESTAPGPTSDEGWPPAVGADDRPVDAVATPGPVQPLGSSAEDSTGTTPPGLLPSVRPPATSASRAYRRLRRIFPG